MERRFEIVPKVEEPKKAEPKVATDIPVVDEKFETQYQKLSGTTTTGQKIDLSQFDKPKKKKEEPKIVPNKPGAPGAAGANNNNNKNNKKE